MHDAQQQPLAGAHRPVVVVGGGQAGLAISHELVGRGVDHVVLERYSIGHEWRARRWDSFCLVTPNRQCLLPGFSYSGPDPDGFMPRDEIVAFLQSYARSFDPPVIEGVAATRLRRSADAVFEITTSAGTMTADQVVLAAGPYQLPSVPRMAERLPASVVQLHSSEYRSPDQLPAGSVLVIGTGQSGCQIAEDLHLAGRKVHLSTGTAPRVSRFYRGRDCMTWLDEIGHYSKGIDEFPDQEATRFKVNHYVTGRDGGHDLDLRAFALEGMRLHGRVTDVDATGPAGRVLLAGDLAANLDGADRVADGIKDLIDGYIETNGIDAPVEERYVPVWRPGEGAEAGPDRLDLAAEGVTVVIWATGYRRDDRWIELPVFDGRGYPTHDRGVTAAPGLYVLGLPWQYTWGSGRFRGVGADATYLATRVCDYAGAKVAV